MNNVAYPQIRDSLTPELKAKFQLVPTRYVGIHAVRAAVCYLTPRVETAFPRGAWEREKILQIEPAFLSRIFAVEGV
jgi:hypothetical protein